MINDGKPIPGTYGALTRSTEEEHQKFRKALNKLFFTKEEFIMYGTTIIVMKFNECMKELNKKGVN